MKKLIALLLIVGCGEVEEWLDPTPTLCSFTFNGNVYESVQYDLKHWSVFVPGRDGEACRVIENPCRSDWESDYAEMQYCEAVAACMKNCSETGADCSQC